MQKKLFVLSGALIILMLFLFFTPAETHAQLYCDLSPSPYALLSPSSCSSTSPCVSSTVFTLSGNFLGNGTLDPIAYNGSCEFRVTYPDNSYQNFGGSCRISGGDECTINGEFSLSTTQTGTHSVSLVYWTSSGIRTTLLGTPYLQGSTGLACSDICNPSLPTDTCLPECPCRECTNCGGGPVFTCGGSAPIITNPGTCACRYNPIPIAGTCNSLLSSNQCSPLYFSPRCVLSNGVCTGACECVPIATPTVNVRTGLPALCPTSTSINTAIGCLPVGDKNEFLAFILRWAIGISGGVSFLFIVYSGFIIMTATGDKRKVQAGRELLTAAVSGILLLIFSVFILDFIGIRILRIPGL